MLEKCFGYGQNYTVISDICKECKCKEKCQTITKDKMKSYDEFYLMYKYILESIETENYILLENINKYNEALRNIRKIFPSPLSNK